MLGGLVVVVGWLVARRLVVAPARAPRTAAPRRIATTAGRA
jgi:hypothetical protein